MTVTRSGRRATRRGGSVRAWRGADESLCDLVAEAPPVPPRLLASHRIWTAGGQGVCAATVLWAAGGRVARAAAAAAVVRAEGAEAQVVTLRAHIYRLAALEQARRAFDFDDAGDGTQHAAAVVRAEGAEAQVATLRAHIYRLAACEQARRALDDASAGAEHEESDGDASG